MKFLPSLLLCLFVCISGYGQFREVDNQGSLRFLRQHDSVLHKNNVKTIRCFDKGSGRHLIAWTISQEGRTISIEQGPLLYGQTQTTYFAYSPEGTVTSMKDQIIKGDPDKGMREFIGPKDYDAVYKAIPDREVIPYNIERKGDTIVSIVCRKPDGLIVRISKFEDDGFLRKSRKFDRFGKLYETTEIRYRKIDGYDLLPSVIESRTETYGIEETVFYDYIRNARGLIVERIERGSVTRSAKIVYNEKGLVIRTENAYHEDVYFSYEYYN